MASRPEVLEVGPVSEATADDAARARARFEGQLAKGGFVNHLYPPQKGWVRVDPTARFEQVSLVDLALLAQDPTTLAGMLLRLTEDDIDEAEGEDALSRKFSDVATLFAALDPRISRIMFGKLARAVLDLAQRGVELAKEHSSAHGPPASLLDQEVVAVSSGDTSVGIPMRCVFALTAMGFLPQSDAAEQLDPGTVAADEIVRVRTLPAWLRIDARFGSVYRRRGDPECGLRTEGRGRGQRRARHRGNQGHRRGSIHLRAAARDELRGDV